MSAIPRKVRDPTFLLAAGSIATPACRRTIGSMSPPVILPLAATTSAIARICTCRRPRKIRRIPVQSRINTPAASVRGRNRGHAAWGIFLPLRFRSRQPRRHVRRRASHHRTTATTGDGGTGTCGEGRRSGPHYRWGRVVVPRAGIYAGVGTGRHKTTAATAAAAIRWRGSGDSLLPCIPAAHGGRWGLMHGTYRCLPLGRLFFCGLGERCH